MGHYSCGPCIDTLFAQVAVTMLIYVVELHVVEFLSEGAKESSEVPCVNIFDTASSPWVVYIRFW